MRWAEMQALGELLEGVPVYGLAPTGPAARAGVRAGDIILEVGGCRVKTTDEYFTAAGRCGVEMRLRVFRGGFEYEVLVEREPSLVAASA